MRPVESSSSSSSTPVRSTTSTPKPEPEKTKPAPPAEPPAETPAEPVASPTRKATVLEGDEPAPSNPSGSRDLTRRQANVATDLTSGGHFVPIRQLEEPTGPSGLADEEESPGLPDDPELDHLVKDPTKKDQRSDLKLKPPYLPGSELPEVPDLTQLDPTSREKQSDGSVRKTFEQDGVTYEVTRDKDGNVTTNYTSDGVSYSREEAKDGSSTLSLFSDLTEDRRYQREITTTADGEVTDSSSVVEGHRDSDGNFSYQEKKVTIGPDGRRTLEEEVTRPDDGRANFTKVTNVDGTSREVYDYTLGETTLHRTTKTGLDGRSETRTEKSYLSDQALEDLIEVPESPEHGIGKQPDLPTDGREPTVVTEVSVVTDDGNGPPELQYEEESYSQTSDDLEVIGELPEGLEVDSDETGLTRTVTKVRVRGDNGEFEESTGVSQTSQLVANRESGGAVTLSNTSTWNAQGESSSSYSVEGLSESEFAEMYPQPRRGAPTAKRPGLAIGEETVPLLENSAELVTGGYRRGGAPETGAPYSDYQLPFEGNVRRYGNVPRGLEEGDAEWLYEDSVRDFTREVSFDADGEVAATGITYGSTDSDGDGRTISATKTPDGPLTWTYSDVSNDGKDFKRQTVVEGTELSTYEERVSHGPGEFTYSSETTEAGEVIESKSASRSKVTESEIQEAVDAGTLTPEQARAVLAGNGPYYLETSQASAVPLVDEDGNLRVDGDDNPIQTGYEQFTSRLSNGKGYEASEYDQSQTDENGDITTSHLSSVTDPTKKPPVSGTLTSTDADFQTETSQVQINNKGQFISDGEVIGEFDLGESDLNDFLQAGGSADALFIGALDTAIGGAEISGNLREWVAPEFQTTTRSDKFVKGATILSTLVGAQQIFAGFQGDNDYEQILGGVGALSTGAESALAAIGGLTDDASRASRILGFSGKALGSVGGVVSLGFGLHDLFTADSGWDKAAGGLSAAAGAVAIGSLWFGPPGWIIGGIASGILGIASIIVGGQDDIGEHDREPIDSRIE